MFSLCLRHELREIPAEGLRQGVAEVEGRSPVPVLDHGDAGAAHSGFPGKRCLRPPHLEAGLLDQGDDGSGKLL